MSFDIGAGGCGFNSGVGNPFFGPFFNATLAKNIKLAFVVDQNL
jgi:hypothetical protein